jgi:ABC-2 type transport system ATP-binding protein
VSPPADGARAAGPPAVEVTGLVKRYGRTTAVDGLSLAVPAGSVLALLGPNGAGKTTTVEICEGFRRADAGTVRVLGLDPVRDARALKPRIGVMLQGGGAYPGARAGEMLRLVASYAAHPLPVPDLLELLGLAEAAGTPYKRLSGGQQQRLSLAMAIVGRPELVFLDEPTAGLDPQARHATWQVIGRLRAGGAAVVLTTHYMDEAERLADHVVVIDHGRQVAGGTPAELTRGGAAGQLRFRAAAGLAVDSLAAALPAGSRVSEAPAGSYLVEGAVDPHLLSAVTAWCAAHGVLAEDLRVERRNLEDVFLEVTGRQLR